MMETNRKRSLEKSIDELEESHVDKNNADYNDENDDEDDRVEPENDDYQEEQSDGEESQTDYNNEEDEEFPPKTPDESLANKLSFYQLSKTLEKIWVASRKTSSSSLITKSKKTTQEEKLSKLLDPLRQYFARKEASTWFPILRLIVPNLDNTRGHLGLKETAIATAWIQALGLRKNNDSYNSIMYFTDPSTAIAPSSAASSGGILITTDGDLSLRVQAVLAQRIPSKQSPKSTIGKINQLLDELAAIKRSSNDKINIPTVGATEVDIVTKQEQDHKLDITVSSISLPQKKSKPPSKQELRKLWVQKLFDLQLSPLEHKWIIRIILQKMDLGIGWSSILRKVSELALDLHNANKNLKKLCACLADQEWIERYKARKLDLAKRVRNFRNDMFRMPCYLEEVQVGNVIRPMLSKRSSCPTALDDMERFNEEFVYLEKQERYLRSLLPIKFPTFIAEVKLDGERMIVHVQRGEVTMHTRQGNWYSRLYSPITAPDIRKALANFDVDVILDGEMLAWDNIDKENIFFGKNKTVAKLRRKWCALNGLIDERDLNFHKEVENHITPATVEDEGRDQESMPDAGANCWLKFVVFDILYLNGPDALSLLKCCNPYNIDADYEPPNEGSLIHLDGFYRKNILYNLLSSVENKVEIVQSLVVCSDGSCISGEKYFQKINTTMAGQQLLMPVDSIVTISMTCDDGITELVESDQKRRANRTDQDIRCERAFGLGRFYKNIVEDQGQEGIMIKNLNAPYILGEASRSKGYWWKLKPDYDGSSQSHLINDLDCLVLGGYYASGLRDSGKINSFLLGCAEPITSLNEEEKRFLTLGCVGKGIANQDYERLLDMTGFGKDDNSNKWFKSNGSLPDFVSLLSFQRSSKGDMDGWKFSKKKFPDLWIKPSDSFVLKILAADIVSSDSYSAGVTFRFPRICGIRVDGFEGAGGKSPEEVESIDLFHELFEDRMNQSYMSKDPTTTDDHHFSEKFAVESCPFLSEVGRKAKRYNRKTVRPAIADGSKIPVSVSVKDEALKGRSFCVLEGLVGSYRLNPNSLDAVEAKEEGWTEVFNVNTRDDVVTFILTHCGQCTLTVTNNTDYILGGKQNDPRVINYNNALQAEEAEHVSKSSCLKKRAKISKNIRGVLKWSYVYRAVALWGKQRSQVKQEADDDCAKKSVTYGLFQSSLIEPRSHDYLVKSKATEAHFASIEDQFHVPLWDELNMLGLKRSLLAVQESRQSESALTSTGATILFQNGFSLPLHHPFNFGHLEENDQWVQSGKRQLFCPFLLIYDEGGVVCGGVRHSEGPAILYPDVFGNDFGLEKSEDATSAVEVCRVGVTHDLPLAAFIPLVESMGALITSHLHEKVTHILCVLKYHDILIWEPSLPSDVLEHQYLHEEMKKRFRNTHRKIKLVSSNWVKKNWEKAHYT